MRRMHVWPPLRVSFDNFQTRPEARGPAYLISPGLSELAKSLRVITAPDAAVRRRARLAGVVGGERALFRRPPLRSSGSFLGVVNFSGVVGQQAR